MPALLKSQLAALPRRFTSMFEKRVEENKVQFSLTQKAAEDEALNHVARQAYLWKARAANKAAQIPLFEMPATAGKSFKKERKL